jgi:hypothetical protein
MDVRTLRLSCGLDSAGAHAAAGLCAPDYVLNAPHPLNSISGSTVFSDALMAPILRAFPHAEERLDILLTGQFAGGEWTASTGHIAGIFAQPLWNIPSTGLPAFLRFGRFDKWIGGRMAETFLLLDLPALMMQSGAWPLARPLGPSILVPGPATRDGVAAHAGDPAEARASLDLVEAMIAALMTYDGGQDLSHMQMVDYWKRDFWWFGPAPIGTFCGHADYERGHQRPFLTAFPDRKGGDHKCRIGEGNYVASTGWPSVRATHSGGGWLGLAPTDRRIGMRVMDFWRRERSMLAENWVFIDIPDLLLQMGVDVFARMAELGPAELRG